jgi:hypothetical protein
MALLFLSNLNVNQKFHEEIYRLHKFSTIATIGKKMTSNLALQNLMLENNEAISLIYLLLIHSNRWSVPLE